GPKRAPPVMRPTARFHADPGRLQLGEKRQNITTPQLLAQHRLLRRIHPMQLKNTLRRIHPNADNLVHGRPSLCWRDSHRPAWHSDAVGGRPSNMYHGTSELNSGRGYLDPGSRAARSAGTTAGKDASKSH